MPAHYIPIGVPQTVASMLLVARARCRSATVSTRAGPAPSGSTPVLASMLRAGISSWPPCYAILNSSPWRPRNGLTVHQVGGGLVPPTAEFPAHVPRLRPSLATRFARVAKAGVWPLRVQTAGPAAFRRRRNMLPARLVRVPLVGPLLASTGPPSSDSTK
jgi:hypothetical protein